MRLKNNVFQIVLSFLTHSELVLISPLGQAAHSRHLSVGYENMQRFKARICRKTQNVPLKNPHGNSLQNA